MTIEPFGDYRDITDEMRADAYAAAHPDCENCGDTVCADPRCHCPEPAALRDPIDRGLLYCSRACLRAASAGPIGGKDQSEIREGAAAENDSGIEHTVDGSAVDCLNQGRDGGDR